MSKKPNVLILKSDGTNCDNELAYAFKIAGGDPEFVHVNQLRENKNLFKKFQILALPGGFSYGDDIMSGKILAVELTSFFQQELQQFVDRKGFVLGICNGFQTLIRTGLLPFNTLGKMHATLTNNDSGHFECRWVKIKVEQGSKATYFDNIKNIMDVAVNHGEGKLLTDEKTLKEMEGKKLVVFRYVDNNGNPTQEYPANPNNSIHAIAGICDPSGRILGLMPHPEKFITRTQHPNWRRLPEDFPTDLPFFTNIIKFVRQS